LTLVSAPAGYGKSTLVSCWLEASDCRGAWLSLDENDNDLHLFLSYFVAAIQTIFPDACQDTQAMLSASDLPPVPVLARSLINELDQMDKAFILALDDYQFISAKAVHELLTELLRHPSPTMHLVLATRRDPPLPLTGLRARNQMTEIRVQQLRFSRAETSAFLQNVLDTLVDDAAAALLEEKTEGWVAGLRLAILSLQRQKDLESVLAELPEDNRYVMDYIVTEVVSKQPPVIQEYLLTTAFLDRFCAPLCEAVCMPDAEPGTCEMSGQEFLEWLEQANLFTIPLDLQHRWFRYHHLFQKLLKRRLKSRYSPHDISALHKQASAWFAENGLIEDALHHALEAGDPSGAAQLMARHRHDLVNQEQWHRLGRWLRMLTRDIVEKDPELLMLEAWYLFNRMRSLEIVDVLDRAESLVALMTPESAATGALQGEIDALRSYQYYLTAHGHQAVAHAQRALEKIPRQHFSERGFAIILLALSYQMTGDLKRAHSVVLKALKEVEVQGDTYHARLLATLCFIHWMDADLSDLQQAAAQYLKLGQEHKLKETIALGRYFLGICHYDRNELTEAESYLASVVKERYIANTINYAHSAFALALIYQAQGRPEEAREEAESVVSQALETRNTFMLAVAEAFEAELAFRQGRIAEVGRWAKSFDPDPLLAAHRFYVPQLTLARVLLARDTTESRQKADAFLHRLHDFYTSIHNTRFQIEVLALQALLHEIKGDKTAALSALEHSVALAEPGGFIRLFVDLGPKMADLLSRLAKKNIAVKYVGKLLTAIRNEEAGPVRTASDDQPVAPLATSHLLPNESLTNRELDILALLGQRKSNKEIAEKLFISPETVKRHTINIYQKLGVNSRQKAVTKAYALGILTRQ
jgi:LuxR family maltose regulon positive regulatory protein